MTDFTDDSPAARGPVLGPVVSGYFPCIDRDACDRDSARGIEIDGPDTDVPPIAEIKDAPGIRHTVDCGTYVDDDVVKA